MISLANLVYAPADMGEATKMVLDGKWLIHLPKLGWWLACEANLAFLIWHLYQPEPASYSTSCASPPWEQASTYLIAVRLPHDLDLVLHARRPASI